MPTARASVFQKADVGLETTEGVAAAALTRFNKLGINLDPNITFQQLRQQGYRAAVGNVAGKKWTGVGGGGNPCYDELAWVLDWLLEAATPTTPGGGTNSRERIYTPPSTYENPISTFTVKQGDKRTRAHQALGAFLTGLTLSWDTDKIDLSIQGLARKFTDDVQLSTNEQQSLIKSGTVTGGTFTLTIVNPETGISRTTAAIAYNASAATIQTALEVLDNVDVGEVVATGGPAPSVAVVIEFRGRFGQINVAAMTVDNTSITGGGTMALTTPIAGVTPTETQGVVLRPEHVSVYLDATSGGLGGTLLTDLYAGSLSLTNFRGPDFTVNRANAGGMSGKVPLAFDNKIKLKVQSNTQGMGIFASADGANPTQFIRTDIQGSLIEGSLFYLLRVDSAVQVANISPLTDDHGIYAIEYDFDIIHDPTWAKSFTVLLRNAVSAVA